MKENDRPISLLNIDALNSTICKKYNTLGFIPGMKNISLSAIQSVCYTTWKKVRITLTLTISVDVEKASDRIQHPFMIKAII